VEDTGGSNNGTLVGNMYLGRSIRDAGTLPSSFIVGDAGVVGICWSSAIAYPS